MRQIDADALLVAIPKITTHPCHEVIQAICDAPTIAAVPLDRLGDFGKLFMDYKGCPRGAIGRACMPIEDEVFQMEMITDVDGGRWIPVNADALHELVKKYTSLLDGSLSLVRCRDCVLRSSTGFCGRHGHPVSGDFFCAYGSTEFLKWPRQAKKTEKKAEERCLATGLACSRCVPGPCDHRKTST